MPIPDTGPNIWSYPNEKFRVRVGICAMKKKTHARPMKEILKRLKRNFVYFDFIVFADEVILNEPIENWPVCDVLISFYSKGFPLHKAISYARLRKPFSINDLEMQHLLQDRREIYRILQESGVKVPRHEIFNRNEEGKPVSSDKEIEESDDSIIVNGKTFYKPFVEKPVSAEDHNIYIYYPTKSGGGCQTLFRKVGSQSSAYSYKSSIRRTGSYIYEDFMPTDGTDVKVYTVGEEYAHAEMRKSPFLDGKVERDIGGKEVRIPVILSADEKLIAKQVCKMFKQTVCGFDLLRSNGRPLVCDVNGFSFVKNSQEYYEDCSKLLAGIILNNLAPQWKIPLPQLFPSLKTSELAPTSEHNMSTVITLFPQSNRVPKEQVEMVVKHQMHTDFPGIYDGPNYRQLSIENLKQVRKVLDITCYLVEQKNEKGTINISKSKLSRMKNLLQINGQFPGPNHKIQAKTINYKWNTEMGSKFKLKGRNKVTLPPLLLIFKCHRELTRVQVEDLGRAFQYICSDRKGRYCPSFQVWDLSARTLLLWTV